MAARSRNPLGCVWGRFIAYPVDDAYGNVFCSCCRSGSNSSEFRFEHPAACAENQKEPHSKRVKSRVCDTFQTFPRVSGKANKNFAGGERGGIYPPAENSTNHSEWLVWSGRGTQSRIFAKEHHYRSLWILAPGRAKRDPVRKFLFAFPLTRGSVQQDWSEGMREDA